MNHVCYHLQYGSDKNTADQIYQSAVKNVVLYQSLHHDLIGQLQGVPFLKINQFHLAAVQMSADAE